MILGKWWFRTAVGFVVVALVAAGGWWFFVRGDASPATSAPEIPDDLGSPTLTTPAGTAPAGSATPSATMPATNASLPAGTTRFVILAEREETEAAYFAEEKLASLPLPSTARGATPDVEGEFYLTATGLAPARTSRFTVDLTRLSSDEARRDARVQETLETDRFPAATFTVERLDGFPANLPAEEDSQPFTMTGTLSLHGIEREVTWEVTARQEGEIVTALATATVRYDDFGMTPPSIAGFVSVEDEVTLQVQVIAVAQ